MDPKIRLEVMYYGIKLVKEKVSLKELLPPDPTYTEVYSLEKEA